MPRWVVGTFVLCTVFLVASNSYLHYHHQIMDVERAIEDAPASYSVHTGTTRSTPENAPLSSSSTTNNQQQPPPPPPHYYYYYYYNQYGVPVQSSLSSSSSSSSWKQQQQQQQQQQLHHHHPQHTAIQWIQPGFGLVTPTPLRCFTEVLTWSIGQGILPYFGMRTPAVHYHNRAHKEKDHTTEQTMDTNHNKYITRTTATHEQQHQPYSPYEETTVLQIAIVPNLVMLNLDLYQCIQAGPPFARLPDVADFDSCYVPRSQQHPETITTTMTMTTRRRRRKQNHLSQCVGRRGLRLLTNSSTRGHERLACEGETAAGRGGRRHPTPATTETETATEDTTIEDGLMHELVAALILDYLIHHTDRFYRSRTTNNLFFVVPSSTVKKKKKKKDKSEEEEDSANERRTTTSPNSPKKTKITTTDFGPLISVDHHTNKRFFEYIPYEEFGWKQQPHLLQFDLPIQLRHELRDLLTTTSNSSSSSKRRRSTGTTPSSVSSSGSFATMLQQWNTTTFEGDLESLERVARSLCRNEYIAQKQHPQQQQRQQRQQQQQHALYLKTKTSAHHSRNHRSSSSSRQNNTSTTNETTTTTRRRRNSRTYSDPIKQDPTAADAGNATLTAEFVVCDQFNLYEMIWKRLLSVGDFYGI